MTAQLKSFAELAEIAQKTTAYHVQAPILEFTEEVVQKMHQQKISKADLAKKLRTSPAYVTKMLSGNNNFTLETMVKVAQSIDCDLRVHLQSKGTVCQWIEVFETCCNAVPSMQDFCQTIVHSMHCPTLEVSMSPKKHSNIVLDFPKNRNRNEELALVS